MENKNNFLIPIAILIAGALITWGVISNDSIQAPNDSSDVNVENSANHFKKRLC